MGNSACSVCCCCEPRYSLRDELLERPYAVYGSKILAPSSLSAPFSFTPNAAVKTARNGIIHLEIMNANIVNEAQSIYSDWSLYEFELRYRYKNVGKDNDIWETVVFSADSINQHAMFYIKTKLHLNDYQIDFKLRAKHQNIDTYFPYSSIVTVNIHSSLIDNTFDIGECVSFCEENAMYVEQGYVDEIFDDSYLQIKRKNNDGNIIKVHTDRVYAEPIYLGFIIDLTDPSNIDQNVLLRNGRNDNETLHLFQSLNESFKSYKHDDVDISEQSEYFMARFVSKNVMDFLFVPYYKEPMIGCLVKDADGWMRISPYIHHSLERHQRGIENESEDVMQCAVQELWSYCDICSVEINRYDWIATCCIHDMIDSHVVCLSCVNNKIEQSEQLKALLNQLLRQCLYDDCIETLVEFVVGKVVAFERKFA